MLIWVWNHGRSWKLVLVFCTNKANKKGHTDFHKGQVNGNQRTLWCTPRCARHSEADRHVYVVGVPAPTIAKITCIVVITKLPKAAHVTTRQQGIQCHWRRGRARQHGCCFAGSGFTLIYFSSSSFCSSNWVCDPTPIACSRTSTTNCVAPPPIAIIKGVILKDVCCG